MRILVINVEIPFPPVGGGPTRTYQLLRALAAHHEVTLVGFTYGHEPETPPFPVRVIPIPWDTPDLFRQMDSDDDDVADRAFALLSSETPEPWSASYFKSPAMAEALELICREDFDLVWIEDTDMGQYIPFLPGGVPRLLDFHNVYSLMTRRAAEAASRDETATLVREAERTLRFERFVASQCNLHVACSEQEARAAAALLSLERVEVVPNGVDTAFFTPSDKQPAKGYMLFTGTMSYAPNVEGVQFFAQSVLPKVLAVKPESRLHIVGMKPAEEVLRLASTTTTVHGAVPDMRPFYAKAEVVVVPVLQGGGTRLKILEAAASGKAVVSTTLGAEGLDLEPGRDIVIADDAEAFARAILALMDDEDRRRELGQDARAASLRFDWRRIGDRYRSLVEEHFCERVNA